MSSIRISVEWGFAQVMRLWAHLDFRNQMKVLMVPTSKMYFVAVALTNMHNCLYPNQTSQNFDIEPPSLEEYLAMNPEL